VEWFLRSLHRQYTNRVFEAGTAVGSSDSYVTRYFDAFLDVDDSTLWLDKECCEIGSITNGDSNSIASSDYVTEPRNDTPFYAIKLLTSSSINWTYSVDPENAIQVAGIWAYSKTVPDDIKHICLRLTKWLEDQRKTEGELDRPLLTGSGEVILPMRLPADVLTVLDMYRRVRAI